MSMDAALSDAIEHLRQARDVLLPHIAAEAETVGGHWADLDRIDNLILDARATAGQLQENLRYRQTPRRQ